MSHVFLVFLVEHLKWIIDNPVGDKLIAVVMHTHADTCKPDSIEEHSSIYNWK